MKIGLVQYSPAWENSQESINKLEKLLNENLADEDLLIFPEMTLTGFTMQSKENAEEIDGLGMKFFIKIAQKYSKHIFAGIIEKEDDEIYNTLIHFDNNGLITAKYRKIHPFSMAKEDKYFSTGKEPFITHINKIKFGLSICYDLRFPELYRNYGKEKVDVIVNIANWPTPRIHHYTHLLRARSIENLCYSIGVNRVGEDPFNKYNGCSCVYDPTGEELVLNIDEEKIITCEIGINKVEETRNKFPFLNDIKLI